MSELVREVQERQKRSEKEIGLVFGEESQFDPGIYTLEETVQIGVLDVVDPFEVWALYSPQPNLPANKKAFEPFGPNHAGTLRSQYTGQPRPVDDLDATIPEAFDRIDARITIEPLAPSTGQGGFTPTRPFLFHEGKYEIIQTGKRVGNLIVEHTAANARRQYWFLYLQASGTTGAYLFPGAVNTDVKSFIRYTAAFQANQDLTAFRATLPVHRFLLGVEQYIKSY